MFTSRGGGRKAQLKGTHREEAATRSGTQASAGIRGEQAEESRVALAPACDHFLPAQ